MCDESICYLILTPGQGVLVGHSGGKTGIRMVSRRSAMPCMQIKTKERFWSYGARITVI